MNTTEIKDILETKGYSLVCEDEHASAYKNENIEYCVIVVNKYGGESDAQLGLDVHEELNKKVHYGKACIGVILEFEDGQDIEGELNSTAWYLRVSTSMLDVIPDSKKDITVTFESMTSPEDEGDYIISPYESLEGNAYSKYLLFLSNKNEDFIVRYPKCLDLQSIGYMRYITGKICKNVKNIR